METITGTAAIDGVKLRVSLAPTLVDRLTILLSPFIEFREDTDNSAGQWHIVQASHGWSLDHLESHTIGHPNEPAQQLWIDPAALVIYTRCADIEFLPLTLTRLIGHMLRLQCLHTGHCFAHAAAVVGKSGAVAIAGGKKSGKTTLALSLIHRHGASFISNDNLSITWRERTARCHGWPRSVRVRSDTFGSIGLRREPDASLPAMTLTHPLNRGAEIPFALDAQVPGTVHIFPFELTRLYNTRLLSTSPLSAIVFLTQCDQQAEVRLRRLQTDEAEELLCTHTFPHIELPSLEHAPYLKKHFLNDLTVSDSHATISHGVPCYLLTNGLNAPEQAANFLAQLSST